MAKNILIVTLKNPKTIPCPKCARSFETTSIQLVIKKNAQMVDGCVFAQAIVLCPYCKSTIKGDCQAVLESEAGGKNLPN